MHPSPSTLIVPPGGGKTLRAFGNDVTVHLGRKETGGAFTLATVVTPPQAGPPLHRHLNDDETFIVTEGRIEFYADGQWTEVSVGSVVFLPKGSVHAFRNPGDVPATMFVQTTPAGFETFFERCAEVFAQPGPPDMARIVSISAEHGIHYLEPVQASGAPGR